MTNFFLALILGIVVNNASAQNILGDTVFVNNNAEVTLRFPSDPIAKLAEGEGEYSINRGGLKNSLALKAMAVGVKPMWLRVDEGGRSHRFLLCYAEQLSTLSINRSNKKELKKYVDAKKTKATTVFEDAERDFDAGNYGAAQAKYNWVQYQLDDARLEAAKSHLAACKVKTETAREERYTSAMAKATRSYEEKKYAQADSAFTEALKPKPGDAQALAGQKKTRDVWVKQLGTEAGKATAEKQYAAAKSKYETLQKLDGTVFDKYYRDSYNAVLEKINSQAYEQYRTKGDDLYRLKEFTLAKLAYDSATLLNPNDKYCKGKAKDCGEKLTEDLKKKETYAAYYKLLIEAKRASAMATSAKDLDAAIALYDQAADLLPSRRFPLDRIRELKKKKGGAAF